MARRVLGNDPFKAGAAARPGEPAAPSTPAPPAAAPARPARPEPRKVVAKPAGRAAARVVKAPVEAAPPRALTTQKPPPGPVGHAHSPTAVALAGAGPLAHGASPTTGPDPIPHPGSPSGSRILPITPPPARPGAQAGPQTWPQAPAPPKPAPALPPRQKPGAPPRAPAPRAGQAPGVLAEAKPGPVAHAASPEAKPVPVPHAASPAVAADPVPHAHSPEAKPVPVPHPASPAVAADPVPHAHSPEARQVPVPHAASPAVAADPVPHAHSPHGREVPPLDDVARPAAAGRAVSPEAVAEEEAQAGAPSYSRPHRGQTLALARTLLESGVQLPLWGAARGLFQAARSALGLGALGELDAWGKDVALTAQLEPLASFLYDRYWRVSVQGAELLPRGPSLIVANHSGALPLDGPMLRYALERTRADLPVARWLVEDQLFHTPFFGVLASRLGAVRANPENALRLLAEGQSVIVFPEGIHGLSRPFAERYQLRRFGRGGFVKIALRAGVPIVPTALVGADEAMPLLGTLPGGPLGLPHLPLTTPPLPARWFLRFGKPIDLKKAPPGAEEDLAFVQRENERTRDAIAAMLTAMLQQRDSVF